MEVTCSNCNCIFEGNYCNNCGQNFPLKKIDQHYVFQELLSILGFEKGFFFTLKNILLKPGATIQSYINTGRQKITKPFTFLFITSVIYTIISQIFKTDVLYAQASEKMYGDSSITTAFSWVQSNYGYANLMMLVPITFWTRLVFRKKAYNFYETFVVVCYIMSVGMLFLSLESLANYFFPSTLIMNEAVVFIISFAYISFGIGQFFGPFFKNYLYAFIAYCLGIITFYAISVFFAGIYDGVVL